MRKVGSATIGLYALLVLFSVVLLFPLLFSLSVSLQGDTVAPRLLPHARLDWGVFTEVFHKEHNLPRWILNSFVVAGLVTLGQVATAALAAYPLAVLRFPGKNLFFLLFLGSLMIPWESTIIPNYLTIASLHWKDSYQGLTVPFLTTGFGIFLLRQSFKSLPTELYEAASVEGCGRTRYLISFLLPLSRPALATLAIYSFVTTWNQYYWPLLVIDNPVWMTGQIGITAFRSSEIASFNLQMAADLVVMAPTLVLLVIGQKQFVRGLTAGALKG
ncbi:MAG TPA: carbohydrate ABC transporter permease [Spirochaetia bacterium]|nr:carbohydrate ABC transporter permease [Spirochaetia bacterium]